MGTHSLTYLYNASSKLVLKFYLQFDGYPSGQGRELALLLREYVAADWNDRAVMKQIGKAIIRRGRLEQPDHAQVCEVCEVDDVKEEWEYHVYHDRVVITETDHSYIHPVTQRRSYRPKSYSADWRTEEFMDLCTRLGYGEGESEDKEEIESGQTDQEKYRYHPDGSIQCWRIGGRLFFSFREFLSSLRKNVAIPWSFQGKNYILARGGYLWENRGGFGPWVGVIHPDTMEIDTSAPYPEVDDVEDPDLVSDDDKDEHEDEDEDEERRGNLL